MIHRILPVLQRRVSFHGLMAGCAAEDQDGCVRVCDVMLATLSGLILGWPAIILRFSSPYSWAAGADLPAAASCG
jgi:hypothetical protein